MTANDETPTVNSCPFCDGVARVVSDMDGSSVRCGYCQSRGPSIRLPGASDDIHERRAIKEWNTGRTRKGDDHASE